MLNEWLRDTTGLGGLSAYAIVTMLAAALGKWTLVAQLTAAYVLLYTLVVAIRILKFKQRPDKQPANGVLGRIDASSFPSLHAARITCLSLLVSVWFDHLLVTGLFTFVAAFVCATRIALKRHDLWDVLGGAILGAIVAGLIIWLVPI